MARTHDPHEAALKAWRTRARAQQHGGVATQLRTDYAPAPNGNARVMELALKSKLDRDPEFAAVQKQAMEELRTGLKDVDIPAEAMDGLNGVDIETVNEFSKQFTAVQRRILGIAPYGCYQGYGRRAHVNAHAKASPAERAETVAHEIGHHAHLSRITDEAAAEWSRISNGGRGCRLDARGQYNAGEHFAVAFAAYSRQRSDGVGGRGREELRKLEPEVYAFMEKLFSGQMWRPNGKALYKYARGLDHGQGVRVEVSLEVS